MVLSHTLILGCEIVCKMYHHNHQSVCKLIMINIMFVKFHHNHQYALS